MCDIAQTARTVHEIEVRVKIYRDMARRADDRGDHQRAVNLWELAGSLKALAAELCQTLPALGPEVPDWE